MEIWTRPRHSGSLCLGKGSCWRNASELAAVLKRRSLFVLMIWCMARVRAVSLVQAVSQSPELRGLWIKPGFSGLQLGGQECLKARLHRAPSGQGRAGLASSCPKARAQGLQRKKTPTFQLPIFQSAPTSPSLVFQGAKP